MSATTTSTQLPVGTWQVDPIHSTAGFAIKHMVVSTFRGRFEELDGRLTVDEAGTAKLVGTVKADSLVVKDENLAGHLKSPDFFDTERYPELRFESSKVAREGDRIVVEGDLTVKDQTHPVRGEGAIVGPHENHMGKTIVGLELTTTIDRTKFGLEWNAPLPKGGFALGNDVILSLDFELGLAE